MPHGVAYKRPWHWHWPKEYMKKAERMLWLLLFLLGTTLAKPKLDEDCELNAADPMVG